MFRGRDKINRARQCVGCKAAGFRRSAYTRVLMPALQSARRAARRVRGAARRAVSPEHGSSQCSKRTPRTRTTRTTPCTWTPDSVSAAAPAPQTRSSFEATSAPCRKRAASSGERAASSGERAASCGAPRRARSSQSACRVASATSGGLAASQVCSCCSHMQLLAFTYTQRSESRSPSRRAGLSARFAQWDWSASAPFASPTRSS